MYFRNAWSPTPWTDGGRRTLATLTFSFSPRLRSIGSVAPRKPLTPVVSAIDSSSPSPTSPVATIKLFPEPERASSMALMTLRSTSQFSRYLLKSSWLNAVWITASASLLADLITSRSSRLPRMGVAPRFSTRLAELSERTSPQTSCPCSIRILVTTLPTHPLAPVTNTFISHLSEKNLWASTKSLSNPISVEVLVDLPSLTLTW
mmetsp:Transcript_2826/g.6596  ORF Transcript_2826/g.6596 Transcript_2826/m.6596 type:complete len:205 (-) Transcript_2826:132-746(-)